MGRTVLRVVGTGLAALAMACGGGDGDGEPAVASPSMTPAQSRSAACANMVEEAHVTRNELAGGQRRQGARLLLRFVHLTDDHIIDDDGQAVIGASAIDPLLPMFESAMRLQEEYADEALNTMIEGINACNDRFPSSFAIVTGDSADVTTVAETRRFIDNLDGGFDRIGAFETACRAELPPDAPAAVVQVQCTRFTGRGVADTQTPDQDIDSPLTQLPLTRTVQQLLATEAAVVSGRAADGSVDPARQTATRSSGMPEVLRCEAGDTGCANAALGMPYLVAFGNHDAYVRGTVPLGVEANVVASTVGRRFMLDQHDFIDEFFFTADVPGPVGHGFQFADAQRRQDDDGGNDGYYAFDAADRRLRMIVLNTIITGRLEELPVDVLRNPFALADGGIDFAQFRWLQDELAAAHDNEQLVMIFSHHPDNSFAEFGTFAALAPSEVTAAQLDAELASWPNVIAWVAGHTHRHRIRAFTVVDGIGSNDVVARQVDCKVPGECRGFWQIETASLIDHPQQQRLIEVFDNGDGTGTLRGSVLTHAFARSKRLAEADDRCDLYLTDPEAVAARLSEADLAAICDRGGTLAREGEPADRNVELMFAIPDF